MERITEKVILIYREFTIQSRRFDKVNKNV